MIRTNSGWFEKSGFSCIIFLISLFNLPFYLTTKINSTFVANRSSRWICISDEDGRIRVYPISRFPTNHQTRDWSLTQSLSIIFGNQTFIFGTARKRITIQFQPKMFCLVSAPMEAYC